MKPLIIAAAAVETRYLPHGTDIVLTGLGKTAAAVATTRAILERQERDNDDLCVINLGSCGALREGMSGVYEPGVVINHDMSADAIRALGHDPHERLELPGGDRDVVLATGDLFVSDSSVRAELAARASLVDMEGYAVVYACQALGVPVRLVKHVSDGADEAALEWATLVDTSARELGAWFEENISH